MLRKTNAALLAVVVVVALGGCSQSREAKEARYLEKGTKEFQRKNYPTAIIHFKNAIAAKPLDAEPYYQLGLCYLALNDFNTAAGALQRATDLNPKHNAAQVKLVGLMANSRSEELLREAEKRMLNVLTNSPGDPDALDVLAAAELRLGKAESAEAHILEALRKSPSRLTSAVALAQLRLGRKDVAGAEEVLKQATQHDAKSTDARVYLGDFYVSQSRLAEAEQQYRQAIAIDQKHGRSLVALASLLARAGRTGEAEQTYKILSQLPDRQYPTAHALYLIRMGKTNEGIAELAKLEAADPSDRAVRTELVKAYLESDRAAEAERVLTAALKKNARDVDALMQRAQIYIRSGKNSEAQTDLNEVLHYRNNSGEAHYLLSKISQARDDKATRKLELGEVLRLRPDYLGARVELAELLTKNGGAQSALQILDEAPGDQKQHAAVVLHRNWALLALNRKAEARKGIDRVLAARPIPEALLQDAVLKIEQKDYAAAKASTDKVLSGNPGEVRALNLMLQIYASQKQLAMAIEKLREHVRQHPDIPDVQLLLGQVLSANNDRAGARAAFNAALAAKADFIPAELAVAELDTVEGKRDDARKRLSTVVSTHPANVPARLLLAEVDLAEGKLPAALEQYRKVVDTDPKNALAMNNVAYILADGKQPDEALKFAQLAKQLAPENATIDDTLGWTYYQKGMYKLAVAHFESATAREDTAKRKYHLAMAYLKAGDPQRGRQTLDAAIKMDPNVPEAQAARQAFAEDKK
jgi:tetratricopeptide (TPR) repeat protein